MIKSLRVPEKLFALATWVVSVLFAWFLVGLGGKLVADLPGVDQRVTLDEFVDSTAAARNTAARDSLRRLAGEREAAQERSRLALTAASNAYRAARDNFDSWIKTRTATSDPAQDPEVLRRTREIEALKNGERLAEEEVEKLDAQMLAVSQAQQRQVEQRAELEEAARGRFERARFRQELGVFAVRLAITLPLLLLAWWLVARKRGSEYWPLARGFVLFAVFTFFVELVPYLPSYGGYVRYGVGVVATAVAGVYVIRAMKRYVARRAEVERQSEVERRRALDYEEALKRMAAGVCPGCERAVAAGDPMNPVNFCVHCGMTLFDMCGSCSSRKNAFYQYCPVCGAAATGPSSEEALTAT